MEFFVSYKTAFQHSIDHGSFAVAHLNHLEKNLVIDTSDCCKVFYLLSGSKRFHINDKVYDVAPGDLFFISGSEWHYFSDFSEEDDHERYVFFLSQSFLTRNSTPETNLGKCFDLAKNSHRHKLSLPGKDQARLIHMLEQMKHQTAFGGDVMDHCQILQALVFLNQLLLQYESGAPKIEQVTDEHSRRVGEITEYIRGHISEEITAESLADHFFLSESYICRRFKKFTGVTLHRYITAQRVTAAKELLAGGATVSDACRLSGFNDYSHFIKVFKSAVGVPPKRYAKNLAEHK